MYTQKKSKIKRNVPEKQTFSAKANEIDTHNHLVIVRTSVPKQQKIGGSRFIFPHTYIKGSIAFTGFCSFKKKYLKVISIKKFAS